MKEKDMTAVVEAVIKGVLESWGNNGMPTCSCETSSGQPVSVNCNDLIPVELSARHVHLSEQDAIALFGAPLTSARELSQPGQFLCNERVRLVGPKGVLDNVAVLGPSRGDSQIEISQTDARTLGIAAPVRQSGNIDGTPGIILTSSKNVIALERGVIVAARHIHMAPEDAKRFGVADKDTVSVRLSSERPVVLEDVLIRVNPNFCLAMHIDSDEGNSAAWNSKVNGKIIAKRTGTDNGCNCCK